MSEQKDYTDNKIFVVDDNPANTMMLKQVVEAEGFSAIYVYNDPQLALDDFYKIKPDLVLLDLLMPNINGIEFLRRIKHEVNIAAVSVIVLTASHDKQQKIEALAMGAQDYIEKPINIIETLQRIKNVLHLQQRKNTFQNLSEDLGGKLKKTRKDLSEVLLTLNTVFDNSSEYVFVANEKGLISDCNKMAQERFEIKPGESNLFTQFNLDDQLLNSAAKELTLTDVKNRRLIVEMSYSKVAVNDEVHYILIFKDVTSRKENEINLKYLAETHYITHLPNRNQLSAQLEEKCASLTPEHQLSFIFISFFENNKVVEFYGHERLEYLLLNIALILVELAGKSDSVLIHWGDNDFLIVEDSIRSEWLLTELKQRFEESVQISDGTDIRIYSKPTLGMCKSGDISQLKSTQYDELVHNALQATFEGARHRHDFTEYDDQLHQKIHYRAMIEKELIKAIENHSFKVAYQPKICMQSKKVISAEALARWPHEEFGLIRPDIFIPIAESGGLINDLGALILTQVFDDAVLLKAKYPHIEHVAVNVAAPQLDQQFITLLEQLLASHGPQLSDFIELEITESSFLDDFERVNVILKQIKTLGFRLAIDDFGTGYSSLSYLHELPIDTLKIDRAFVNRIVDSQRSLLLVKSIISMSLSLGLDIVAEGIEDLETGELLASLGVQQGQGFYYYRPEFL
ncbi:MAG: EAL domain-containing protein (putative c-di-GMP-specific phosphodiesterase class I) [Phenylobacterium sp.]|jgi:EAL domain-containing protein (putative c-di-GMP-specific phosphodiesterase class I)/DNA-binding response OmpR family regulator/GGDEF domain-containing protein